MARTPIGEAADDLACTLVERDQAVAYVGLEDSMGEVAGCVLVCMNPNYVPAILGFMKSLGARAEDLGPLTAKAH